MIFCTFTARQSGKYAVYQLRHRFCSAFRKQNKQFSEWPKKGTVRIGESLKIPIKLMIVNNVIEICGAHCNEENNDIRWIFYTVYIYKVVEIVMRRLESLTKLLQ